MSADKYPSIFSRQMKAIVYIFDGLPLLTLKTDRLDLRGLDQEKMTLFTHH